MKLLPWQQADWHQLAHGFERLPGALLLAGPQGIGKDRFARFLAQSLLCEQPLADHAACGECEACRWFAAGNHPDYRYLAPENREDDKGARRLAQIKIEAIRDMIDFAQLTAHRGGRRVIVLEPAEALNLAAANALLKILEEPPEDVHFILVAHRPRRLLPTLLSRCRTLVLTPPDAGQALEWLTANGVADAGPELAHAGGAPFALTEPERIPLRERLIDTLAHPDAGQILAVAAELDRARLALAEPLDWLRKWLHDLMSVTLAGPVRYHPERQAELSRLAGRTDAARLVRFDRELLERVPFGQHTLNVRLQLEALLFDYQSLFAAARAA